jgi:putative phage-type endonuclease
VTAQLEEARPLVTPTAHLVLPRDAPRDEWLAARKKGIGSSDAAAILGLDPWNSPLSLWLEKTNRVDPDEHNEAMQWGQVLEGPIADEYGRRAGVAVLPPPGMLGNVETPWLLANPDRMLAPADEPLTVVGFVEVKNVSGWKSQEWDSDSGVVPPHYLVQVLHQLATTGYEEAVIAALVGGQKLEYMTVQRDEALIEMLLEREAAFWDMVQRDIEPAWDGSAQSIDAVRQYRAEPGKVYDLTSEDMAIVERIRLAKARTASLRRDLKLAEADEKVEVGAMQARMTTAELAVDPETEEVVFTWKESPRKEYTVEATTIRTFRMK